MLRLLNFSHTRNTRKGVIKWKKGVDKGGEKWYYVQAVAKSGGELKEDLKSENFGRKKFTKKVKKRLDRG